MQSEAIVAFRFARPMKVSELASITRRAATDRSLTLRDAIEAYGKMALVEKIRIGSVGNDN